MRLSCLLIFTFDYRDFLGRQAVQLIYQPVNLPVPMSSCLGVFVVNCPFPTVKQFSPLRHKEILVSWCLRG